MKKHCLLLTALVAGMLLAGAAGAQVFGQYTGAPPIAVDSRLFGAYASFTDSESELLTQLRLSYYPSLDFGFQGGIAKEMLDERTSTAVKLGADFKALVLGRSETSRYDLSLGGALGLTSAEDYNVLEIGPQLAFSRKFGSGKHTGVTLYTAALLLFSRSDIGGSSNSDVAAPLRLGAEFAPGRDVRLVVEYEYAASDDVHEDHRLTVGANFPF